jgi:integrative and conjugative element protein (TIGR02256 family)
MLAESRAKHPYETGGLLVGRLEVERVILHCATPPGPNAVHTPTYFNRDGVYSQRVLDLLVARYRGHIDYVGEWHSHPRLARPSLRDLKSMRWIAENTSYKTNHPVLVICVRHRDESWQLQAYLLIADGLRPLRRDPND